MVLHLIACGVYTAYEVTVTGSLNSLVHTLRGWMVELELEIGNDYLSTYGLGLSDYPIPILDLDQLGDITCLSWDVGCSRMVDSW